MYENGIDDWRCAIAIVPLSRTFCKVPVSRIGVLSDCASAPPAPAASRQAAAQRSANFSASRGAEARASEALIAASGVARLQAAARFLGGGVERARVRLGFRLGQQFTLPLRDDRGRDRVADRVGRRAAHVEEGVDAED